MNKLNHIYMCLALLLCCASCKEENELVRGEGNECVLKGIRAYIDNGSATRAMPPALIDSIGKFAFTEKDNIVFTKIERTIRPIRPTFSYSNVLYTCTVSGKNVSWNLSNGGEDIYWSDGLSPHTFIGYNLPHEDAKTAEESEFDWNKYTTAEGDVYYGSIGDPTKVSANDVIDYTCVPGPDTGPNSEEKLRKEDLLLSYTTEQQNGEDAMADIIFHHGLASVRVVVTLTGFSTTGDDPDSKTKVTDMVLHNQPTMYKWDQTSAKAKPLTNADQAALNSFNWTGGTAPAWDQKKEMKLWQPRVSHSSGVNRTFSFYGIVAPGNQEKVSMTFKVAYPNPLDPAQAPENNIIKEYTAELDLSPKMVEFRPCYCTNINVNLNHKDEKMTVGAEYMEWQYIDQPNQGSLRKNSTYLSYTDRSKVTIVGDDKATADDATWLYKATSGKIVDIYGNDGTPEHPFLICTADQLLSFAYEVKGTNRTAVTYNNVITNQNNVNLDGSFDFSGYYIKLDADITMQESKSSTGLQWIGIGDANHPFNGVFFGSGRCINNLLGQPLFDTIGNFAVVDKVNFAKVINVVGSGVVANVNNGLICGCNIEGNVAQATPTASGDSYCGSIVGDNKSFIVACTHVGNVTGYGYVGGLVGYNEGALVASYHAGLVAYGDNATNDQKQGIGGSTGKKHKINSVVFSCYQNRELINHIPNLLDCRAAWPLTTLQMQSDAFVNSTAEPLGGWTLESAAAREDGDTYSPYIEGADKHYSLNKALQEFSQWVNGKAAQAAVDGKDVVLPCHTFNARQVQVLNGLFSKDNSGNLVPAHLYKYVPGTYPKVQ